MRLILERDVGDGCTFSATECVPIEAESKEQFLSELETHFLAWAELSERIRGYVPYEFTLGSQKWAIEEFIENPFPSYQPTYNEPTIYTVDEWFEQKMEKTHGN